MKDSYNPKQVESPASKKKQEIMEQERYLERTSARGLKKGSGEYLRNDL